MEKILGSLLSTLLVVLRILPRRLFPVLGALLATVVRPFAKKDRARFAKNVETVFGLPPKSHFHRVFERQVFRHQAVCALETLSIIDDPSKLELIGEPELNRVVKAAEAGGKGHIVVTAHLGSWELCAYLGRKAAAKPFHVLAKPPRRAVFLRFLNTVRERMGVDVYWTDRKSLLRDMLGALKKGESVGFVMDQKPEGRKGPVVPFFGIPTEFVSGPAAMAIRTGCAVVSIFCLREGPFRFRVLAHTLARADHGETDEIALTRRMAAEIEAVIRLYPEQWTWSYKRWRDPPVAR